MSVHMYTQTQTHTEMTVSCIWLQLIFDLWPIVQGSFKITMVLNNGLMTCIRTYSCCSTPVTMWSQFKCFVIHLPSWPAATAPTCLYFLPIPPCWVLWTYFPPSRVPKGLGPASCSAGYHILNSPPLLHHTLLHLPLLKILLPKENQPMHHVASLYRSHLEPLWKRVPFWKLQQSLGHLLLGWHEALWEGHKAHWLIFFSKGDFRRSRFWKSTRLMWHGFFLRRLPCAIPEMAFMSSLRKVQFSNPHDLENHAFLRDRANGTCLQNVSN